MGIAKFLDNDELAGQWFERYAQRALRAFSIGFIGNRFEMRNMGFGSGPKRIRVWTEIELIEISCVSVPSNREALVRSAFETADTAILDDNDAGLSNRRLNKVLARTLPKAIGERAEQIEEVIERALEADILSPIGQLIEQVSHKTALKVANAIIDQLNERSSRAKGAPLAHLNAFDLEEPADPDDPYIRDLYGGDQSTKQNADDVAALLAR